MQYQLLQLKKEGDQQHIYYENDEKSFHIPLEDEVYSSLFQKFEPNFSFLTFDKMIQHNVHDGSIIPLFKNGNFVNDEDTESVMDKVKKEMNYVKDILDKKKSNNLKGLKRKRKKTKPVLKVKTRNKTKRQNSKPKTKTLRIKKKQINAQRRRKKNKNKKSN